ncbi:MAG: hypothetical protein V9G63_10450 [Candidatus Competibacter sp.]
MTDNSDKRKTASRPPDGSIPVDPEEGFGPLISEAFLEQYGNDSVFVIGTIDCLTHRFVHVLIRAGRLPIDYPIKQYGSNDMRESLEHLIEALNTHGIKNPLLLLMRSAIGHERPQEFLACAGSILGPDVIAHWLRRLESEDYEGARVCLSLH